jgi:hypothetical protein
MGIAEYHEFNLLLPESVTRPLWRSLLLNLRDRVSPEKLPPLELTSRPMDIGMLLGDILSLPWYRTVFTNLGNVITPETLPPLELESRPVNVGELISDRLSHLWWSSLLRNLADAVSPEPLPALELTSIPANFGPQAGSLQLVRWSSLLSTPKVFLPDAPKPAPSPVAVRVAAPPLRPVQAQANPLHSETYRIQGRLSRSRLREALLVSAAVLEMLYLVASYIGWM